eukprot:1140941-Pelagomonas_calceolata.AAC.3
MDCDPPLFLPACYQPVCLTSAQLAETAAMPHFTAMPHSSTICRHCSNASLFCHASLQHNLQDMQQCHFFQCLNLLQRAQNAAKPCLFAMPHSIASCAKCSNASLYCNAVFHRHVHEMQWQLTSAQLADNTAVPHFFQCLTLLQRARSLHFMPVATE